MTTRNTIRRALTLIGLLVASCCCCPSTAHAHETWFHDSTPYPTRQERAHFSSQEASALLATAVALTVQKTEIV
jgi:hypothetical protein